MNLNNIDLNKIRVFQTVVEKGNYRLAGEELGLTRSAISQSITVLESQIGVSLFQRKGRKLYPTHQAKEFAEEFAVYQTSLAQALRKIRDEKQKIEGLVRVGSYFEFAKSQISSVIKSFCEKHPGAQIRLVFDSPSRLCEMLENDQIDLSFSIFQHKGTPDIQSKKMFEQELVLIAPAGYSKQAGELESLIRLPIIEYFKSHQVLPRWIRAHYDNKRPKLSPQIFAASADMLIELVNQGAGVGVAPLYLVEAKASHNIRIIRPTEKRVIDYIWFNQFRNQFKNSAHKEFCRLLT